MGEGPWGHLRGGTHLTTPTLISQGVVPFLGMFLYHLKLLDIGMADDLEVSEPGGGDREQDPEVWVARALHWDLSSQYLANLLS